MTVALCLLLALASCVQPTKTQEVEFRVETTGMEDVQTIGVRGSLPPLDWGQDLPLEDGDGDGIYVGTVVFEIPYDYVEVKFVKNGSVYELDGAPDRKVVFHASQKTSYSARFDQAK